MSSSVTRIAELRLRSQDPTSSVAFVQSLLPSLKRPPSWPGVARLSFSDGDGSEPQRTDALPAFWKLSVHTDDIVSLAAKLRAAGIEVTDPIQFGDIGYLCHLTEPGGNAMELIQRTFIHSPSLQLSSPDTLGLITLRISDPWESMRFYVEALGMQLLATMAVDDGRPDPFDLYFLGYSDEESPDSDPAAVANREWLYQRQATLIELQHYRHPTPPLQSAGGSAPGLDHVLLETGDLESLAQRLQSNDFEVRFSSDQLTFESPDGHQYRCTPRAN